MKIKRKSGATRAKAINSRQKGAGGEREFSKVLQAAGIQSRRGQQFSGGKDSPDVTNDLTNVHFEVKRTEAGNPYKWFEQAKNDGTGKMPIVAHRKNGEQWLGILDMNDLIDLLITREIHLL